MSHNGIFHFAGFAGLDLNDFDFDNFVVAYDQFNDGDNTGFDLQNYQCTGPRNMDSSLYLRTSEVGETPVLHWGRGLRDVSYLNGPTLRRWPWAREMRYPLTG